MLENCQNKIKKNCCIITSVAGTNVGTVSKYPTVLVQDRTRKYIPRNIIPSKQDIPPHIKHQTTYFRRPVPWGAETK